MTLALATELTMLAASLGFGAYAIAHWRRSGRAVLDGLGLRFGRSDAADLLAGLVIAGVAMAGIFVTERAMGGITTATTSVQPGLLPRAAVMALHAFKEELLMRSLLLSGLLLALGNRRVPAVGLSALAFGLIHLSNPGASALSVLGNALGGVIYGTAFVLTGRIWLSLGLHFAWNFVQGPLLGLPVSGLASGGMFAVTHQGPDVLTGGSYGPEGGLVGIGFRFVVIGGLLGWVAFGRARRSAAGGAPVAAEAG